MSGLNILVTGATGFVGRHLVEALLARGNRVRTVARTLEKARGMPWINRVEFVAADIHSETLDIGALTQDIDILVHLAWTGLPNYQALFHFENNMLADYTFVKRVVALGVRQVLVTGTCFEYGQQSGPLDEHTAAQPNTAYGLAKNTLRLFLESLQREHPFVLQWARLFYLYGPGQNTHSLLASLDRAIDVGDESFNMSAGEQLRDYLAIDVAADLLAQIVQHGDFNGLINCCSGRPISVRALVEQRLSDRGSSMTLNLGYYAYPSHEPMAFWGVADRLQQLLNQPPSDTNSGS